VTHEVEGCASSFEDLISPARSSANMLKTLGLSQELLLSKLEEQQQQQEIQGTAVDRTPTGKVFSGVANSIPSSFDELISPARSSANLLETLRVPRDLLLQRSCSSFLPAQQCHQQKHGCVSTNEKNLNADCGFESGLDDLIAPARSAPDLLKTLGLPEQLLLSHARRGQTTSGEGNRSITGSGGSSSSGSGCGSSSVGCSTCGGGGSSGGQQAPSLAPVDPMLIGTVRVCSNGPLIRVQSTSICNGEVGGQIPVGSTKSASPMNSCSSPAPAIKGILRSKSGGGGLNDDCCCLTPSTALGPKTTVSSAAGVNGDYCCDRISTAAVAVGEEGVALTPRKVLWAEQQQERLAALVPQPLVPQPWVATGDEQGIRTCDLRLLRAEHGEVPIVAASVDLTGPTAVASSAGGETVLRTSTKPGQFMSRGKLLPVQDAVKQQQQQQHCYYSPPTGVLSDNSQLPGTTWVKSSWSLSSVNKQ
jgi:hypothetical protein